MTKHLQSAYDQAAKDDLAAQERLEKIMRPDPKVSKKQPPPKQTWLEETPIAKPHKKKSTDLRTKQALTGYSATQRWRLAKQFAIEKLAEEGANIPEFMVKPN